MLTISSDVSERNIITIEQDLQKTGTIVRLLEYLTAYSVLWKHLAAPREVGSSEF